MSPSVTSFALCLSRRLVQEFFKEQLHKHDEAVDILEKNLTAQDNILRALTETNAKYARVKRTIDETERRCVSRDRAQVRSRYGVRVLSCVFSVFQQNVERSQCLLC